MIRFRFIEECRCHLTCPLNPARPHLCSKRPAFRPRRLSPFRQSSLFGLTHLRPPISSRSLSDLNNHPAQLQIMRRSAPTCQTVRLCSCLFFLRSHLCSRSNSGADESISNGSFSPFALALAQNLTPITARAQHVSFPPRSRSSSISSSLSLGQRPTFGDSRRGSTATFGSGSVRERGKREDGTFWDDVEFDEGDEDVRAVSPLLQSSIDVPDKIEQKKSPKLDRKLSLQRTIPAVALQTSRKETVEQARLEVASLEEEILRSGDEAGESGGESEDDEELIEGAANRARVRTNSISRGSKADRVGTLSHRA